MTRNSRSSPGGNNCLPRTRRLLTSREFTRVLKNRRTGRTRYFRYSVSPNDKPGSRLGVTVSRKVSASSVRRNRIRRQIKEFFRKNKDNLGPYDLVVAGLPDAGNCTNSELRKDLNHLWTKLENQLKHY